MPSDYHGSRGSAEWVPVGLHVADLAVGGVIGAYAVKLCNWLVARTFHRQPDKTPPSVLAVREAARWAVNALYSDVLPVEAEPVTETISPFRWSVVFEQGPDRFTVTCDLAGSRRDADAEVQRTSIG